MSDKITTSAGVFVKNDWYLSNYSGRLLKVDSLLDSGRLKVRSTSGEVDRIDPKDLVEVCSPDRNYGKIEPLPWEPKCDGKSVYQVSDEADFSCSAILTRVKEVVKGGFIDENNHHWNCCRPVPTDQRVWGD